MTIQFFLPYALVVDPETDALVPNKLSSSNCLVYRDVLIWSSFSLELLDKHFTWEVATLKW